jgi:hypothetical protein
LINIGFESDSFEKRFGPLAQPGRALGDFSDEKEVAKLVRLLSPS